LKNLTRRARAEKEATEAKAQLKFNRHH
jgi:hypothetical protein